MYELTATELAKTRAGRSTLIALIGSGAPPRVRQAAAYGFIRSVLESRGFNVLLGRLMDAREDAGVRGQIAEVLSGHIAWHHKRRRRDWVARVALRDGLDDPSREVRFWCIFALASSADRSLIPKLTLMLDDAAEVPGFGSVGTEAAWAVASMKNAGC